MRFRWVSASTDRVVAGQLASDLSISPLLAQCLLNRGLNNVEQISRFIEPRLKQMADPFLIPGMDAAVDRILAAAKACEPIVIFGDYDVDGVSASALLM